MNDILSLFIADLHRSIDGLEQSIELGTDGVSRAALHAHDLSDGLQGVGMNLHADIAFLLSRGFSEQKVGTEQQATVFIDVMRRAIDMLAAQDVSDVVIQQQPQLLELLNELSDTAAQHAMPPAGDIAAPIAAPIATPALTQASPPIAETPGASQSFITSSAINDWGHESFAEPELGSFDFSPQGSVAQPEHEQQVFARESVATDLTPAFTSATKESAIVSAASVPSSTFAPPIITAQTISVGLAQIAAADHAVAQTQLAADTAYAIRTKLQDHADWLVSQGQFPLSEVITVEPYRTAAHTIYASRKVADGLGRVLGLLPQAGIERIAVQHATLFLDLSVVSPASIVMERIAREVAQLHGRVESTSTHLRLVLPLSDLRFRVVPFVRGNAIYAVSWAQFVSSGMLQDTSAPRDDCLGSTDGTRLCLTVQVGVDQYTLHADESCPFEMANRFDIPAVVDRLPAVAGVLVGASAQPLIWLDPSRG